MTLGRVVSALVFALALVPATICAEPMAQFAYRDVTLHFASADGKPVSAASIYGFCRDFNLIWPRRDHEVRDRNDILWQESFLGKTGADGSVKATIPPGHWRFFAAGTTADGTVIAACTEPREPSPGETIQIAATTTKHWSLCSSDQVALSPKRLFIRAQQMPVWIPVRRNAAAAASVQFEVSPGPFDLWIGDDSSAADHSGYALAMPTVSSQTPDGRVAATNTGFANIVFKGGKGQAVLSWACPTQFGLDDEIALCDGAHVVLSAGDYFLSYRRPIGNGLTASFIAQRYHLQPGQAGTLDLESPIAAAIDDNFATSKKGKSQLFCHLYMADANGHLMGTLLDASHHPVRFDAAVTLNGARIPARSYVQASPESRTEESDDEPEVDDPEGIEPSPFAPDYLQMVFGIDNPPQPTVEGQWEITTPPGILPQTKFTKEAPVAVSSTCFSTNVPRVAQRQASNMLQQADGMIHTMEQVCGHGRSKYSVTQLIILPNVHGASSTHNGLRTTIPPRILYSDQPMAAHTIIHETGHNFDFNHGGLMESVVEVTRCGVSADQISQQPVKWIFLDRMNGLKSARERPYQNVGLYLYFYAQNGPSFLHLLSSLEGPNMQELLKKNYAKDDLTAAFLTSATGHDSNPICTNYGLTLTPQGTDAALQQVKQLASSGGSIDTRSHSPPLTRRPNPPPARGPIKGNKRFNGK